MDMGKATRKGHLGRGAQLLLAAACAAGISSLYYVQPLLLHIADEFHLSVAQLGFAPMATQLGVWLGVLLLMPLGDIVDGKRLSAALLAVNGAALIALGFSKSTTQLFVISALVGISAIVPYLVPPVASRLVDAGIRGRLIGTLAAGVFAGMLLSRAMSGVLGEYGGWRLTFWIGGALCVFLAMALYFRLPSMPVSNTAKYVDLMGSLWRVLRSEKRLQQAALTQGSLFASFNVFWLALPLHLAGPTFELGSSSIAGFAVVGLIGIGMAPITGKLADRFGSQVVIVGATGAAALSWLVFGAFGNHLLGLIVGVVILDLGTTSSHVANQAKAFSLSPNLRSRIGTLYVLALYTGAAIFSPLTTLAYEHLGWHGVAALGATPAFIAFAFNLWHLIHDGRSAEFLPAGSLSHTPS
jgi:predicted MFS family arabinose efflux permease